MSKSKNSKLSTKIALYFIACFVSVMMAATLIGSFALQGRYDQLDRQELMKLIYVGISFLGLITLLSFAFCMNKLIVKRVAGLNNALEEVAKGNFDVHVPEKGKDELSALTGSFNMMVSELKAKELLSKDFARYVSHEYKTPLSIIRGYAELLEVDAKNDEDKESAGMIIAEADRLSKISKNIMELSMLDSTTIIKQEDNFSPAIQIRTILQSTHFVWNMKKIEFDLDLDDFIIKSNEGLLFRVWQNLISNAVKFSDDGGIIKVLLKRRDSNYTFQIINNGIGIREEDKERVFMQFFVGDRSRNKEGSGLGLPLAHKIVEKLGGTIRFESQQGEGTKFIVEIPIFNYQDH